MNMKLLHTHKIISQWQRMLLILPVAGLLFLSCNKRSQCPVYWEGAGNSGGSGAAAGGADKTDWKVETNATKPADGGGGDSGQSAGSGDPETTSEFPMVRVKRDKNGIVTKKPMARNKVKRTDPRKTYKGT
jgi:hypothetical protein